ncbi:hypothetical protein BDZ89DRAFT_320696 [Hymenopellis radicata]|nr:hypothetical protein BDZ89DRAFT_320696 [Hymenopellis radicata]
MAFNPRCRYNPLGFQESESVFYLAKDDLIPSLSDTDPFAICDDCYNFFIAASPLASAFTAQTGTQGNILVCSFSSTSFSLEATWSQCLSQNTLEPLKARISQLQERLRAVPACPSNEEGKDVKMSRRYFTFALPDQMEQEQPWRMCGQCYSQYIGDWPSPTSLFAEVTDKCSPDSMFCDLAHLTADPWQSLRCVFVLFVALKLKNMEIFVVFIIASRQCPNECKGSIAADAVSFGLDGLPDFRICEGCHYKSSFHFPQMKDRWLEITPAGTSACAMGGSMGKLYLLQLAISFWKDDPGFFLDFARRLSPIPGCPAITAVPAASRTWYTSDAVADFDVCAQCYELAIRGTSLSGHFHARPAQTDMPDRTCDFFGARTRAIYREACNANDISPWIHFMTAERPALFQSLISQKIALEHEVITARHQMNMAQIRSRGSSTSAFIYDSASNAMGINYSGTATPSYSWAGSTYNNYQGALASQERGKSNQYASLAMSAAIVVDTKSAMLKQVLSLFDTEC